MITGILLAGGRGRRFGGNKLLAPLADGTPVVVASARALAGVVDRLVVVVAAEAQETAAVLAAAGYPAVRCADANQGMAHSLRCGVAASADASAWVIALGDMPFVKPASLAAIVHALREGADLVVPHHEGVAGHPVGFAAGYGEELRALSGDRGARAILERHAAAITTLNLDDPGLLADIDTPADLN